MSLTFETSRFLCSAFFGSRVLRSKSRFDLALSGITNDDVDLSVDALKAVTLPLLKLFGVAEEGGLELKVLIEYTRLAIAIILRCCCFRLLFTACVGSILGSTSNDCAAALVCKYRLQFEQRSFSCFRQIWRWM